MDGTAIWLTAKLALLTTLILLLLGLPLAHRLRDRGPRDDRRKGRHSGDRTVPLRVGLVAAFALAAALPAGCGTDPGRTARPAGERTQSEAGAPRREVLVAAAADLKFAMEELIEAFRRDHPDIRVKATYGSSGNLATQIENGAPFDIFFSADVAYPQRLADKGLTAPGSEFTYAVGRLVLWVPRSSPIAVEKLGIKAVGHRSVRHVAIANPRHAPYGRAAEAALERLGVYDAVKDRLVYGENVAQAAEFVQSGAADIGVIALSLALAPTMRDKGRYWEIPLDAYPRMEQSGAILSQARDKEAAWIFRAFVLSGNGRAILKSYGFFLPEERR